MKKMINWAAVVMVALTMSIGCGDDKLELSEEDAAKMQQMSESMTEGGSTMEETGEVADPGEGGEEAAAEGGEEAAEGGEEAAADGGEEAAAEGGEEAAADGGEEAAAEASEEAAEGTEQETIRH